MLPTGVTDELQLIDDGIGIAVKREMGNRFDVWAMEGNHLERWTADGKSDEPNAAQPMEAWEKRVLITRLAAEAWEHVCATFNFEKAATRLGMRMTSDGSDDACIMLQGLETYSFTDADGGEEGALSDDDPVDMEEREADIADEDEDAGEPSADEQDEQQQQDFAEGGSDESDGNESEEDDTVDPTVVRTTVGNAPPLAGFTFATSCPPLETPADRNSLIGRLVYVGWDSNGVRGWYMGTIHSTVVSARDKQKTPSANFVVKYTSQRTNNQVNGLVACELSDRVHGPTKWWVLLEKIQ